MPRLVKQSITVTPAGGAGAAAADQTLELGEAALIHAIRLTFANEPATTDVTITDDYANGSTVLAQSNSNTNKLYYPRVPASKSADGTNSALTEAQSVSERLRVQVAQ